MNNQMNNQMNYQPNYQGINNNQVNYQQVNNQPVNNGQAQAGVYQGISNNQAQTAGARMNPSMRVQSGTSTTMTQQKTLSKGAISNPKYTENWLNLKTIKNGIMYTKEGFMVAGVKIEPKNIFILESYQGANIITGLSNFYNLIDFEFWIMAVDRPVDISMYQAEMQLLYNRTHDPKLRKIIAQDMNKGDNFINNDVADIEFFILFKEKKMDLLQKKVRNIINGLAGANLIGSQASTEDMRMLLDNILNGGTKYESGGVIF